MKLLTIHSKSVNINYKHSLCSFATLFVAITTLSALLIPFYIVIFANTDLWHQTVTIYEQPNITFMYKYNFLAITENEEVVACSSVPYVNQILENVQKCATIKFVEDDFNNDGLTDSMEISFHLDISRENPIKEVIVQLFFEGIIHADCYLNIPTVFLLQENLNIAPNTQVIYHNRVNLHQKSSFYCPFFARNVQSRFNPFNLNATDFEEYRTMKVYEKLKMNPAYIGFDDRKKFSETVEGHAAVKIQLEIGEISARYHTSVWRKVRELWIQYFCLAILFLLLVQKVKDYAFSRFIVRAWESIPWKKAY
uniref:Transmembrane protein 231 n=1 Tax=Phlebotomus papatasi TaxID=29031 RepID=A0A1B0DG49_PHLPP